MVFIQFIPPHITRWVSVALFVVFGLKMLHEGWNMTATDAAEEMEEVQHDIRKREDEVGQLNDIVSHESTRVCCSVRCKFIRHELLTKSNPKILNLRLSM